MTENIAVEPTVEIVEPSKLSVLKSKITREGVILGGIVTGILIAGGTALLKNRTPDREILASDVSLEELKTYDTLNAMNDAGTL